MSIFQADYQNYVNENYEPPTDEDVCFACEQGYHNRCEREFRNKGRYWNCSCDCEGEE